MRRKSRYGEGDMVQLVKSCSAMPGSSFELRPPQNGLWTIHLKRTEVLTVIRHEDRGGTPRFVGSVLCLGGAGLLWVDGRNVALVFDASEKPDDGE